MRSFLLNVYQELVFYSLLSDFITVFFIHLRYTINIKSNKLRKDITYEKNITTYFLCPRFNSLWLIRSRKLL